MGPAEDEGEQERDPLRAAREVNLETRVAMGLVGATKSIVIHRDEYTYTGWESTLTNVSIGDVGKNKYLRRYRCPILEKLTGLGHLDQGIFGGISPLLGRADTHTTRSPYVIRVST